MQENITDKSVISACEMVFYSIFYAFISFFFFLTNKINLFW